MKQVMRRRGASLTPSVDLPLLGGDEPAFLRPKSRARIRRVRRGWLGRAALAVQVGGALLFCLSALWAGYARVMASERLKVGHVDVRGGHFLSEGEVRELLGPAVGENILGLDIDALKARLRACPWVADATVRRALPDTLEVEIRERVPLALAEADGLYLMDSEGTLIDLYGPRTAAFDLPIVRGLAGISGEVRRERAQRAGALLRDLDDLAKEVSEVHVEETGDLRVVLRGAGEVLLMGAPPYRKKLTVFLTLRSELDARCPAAEYFDLRFRDRIYAREPAQAAVPVADAKATATPARPSGADAPQEPAAQ